MSFPRYLLNSVFGRLLAQVKKFKFDKKMSNGKGKGLDSTLRLKNRANSLLPEIVTFQKHWVPLTRLCSPKTTKLTTCVRIVQYGA
jgi:hypothetical protein